MALKGNGSTDGIVSATIAAGTPTRWSFSLAYRNAAAPGTAVIDVPFSVGTSARLDFGFLWDNTTLAQAQSVSQTRASTVTDSAKFTTSLQADTWYMIGGRYDGTNITAWLNGVIETTTASADPATSGTVIATWLRGSVATFNDDGNVAFGGLWTTNLIDDEMAALGKGFHPTIIRPASLLVGADFTRDARSYRSLSLTLTGGTVADNPKIIMPRRRSANSFTAAAGGGFQAAWAAGANSVLSSGARAA